MMVFYKDLVGLSCFEVPAQLFIFRDPIFVFSGINNQHSNEHFDHLVGVSPTGKGGFPASYVRFPRGFTDAVLGKFFFSAQKTAEQKPRPHRLPIRSASFAWVSVPLPCPSNKLSVICDCKQPRLTSNCLRSKTTINLDTHLKFNIAP